MGKTQSKGRGDKKFKKLLSELNIPLGRPTRKWVDNIKINIKEMGHEYVFIWRRVANSGQGAANTSTYLLFP
jgi:hypothetical protein